MKDVGHLHVASRKVEGADSDGKAFFLAAQDLDKVYRIDTASRKGAGRDRRRGQMRPADLRGGRCCRTTVCSSGAAAASAVKPSLVVLDGTAGTIVYSAEIGGGTDSLAYDPGD